MEISIADAEKNANHEILNSLILAKKELSNKQKQLHDMVREKTHELAKLIAQEKRMFALLDAISELNEDLAKKINQLAVTYGVYFEKALAEIKSHYKLPEELNLKVIAKEAGASEGFIIEAGDKIFYAKESLSYREDKKINPKELFIYKLLEYAQFGPKTEFILRVFSTSRTGAQICYVSTQDVRYTKSKDKRKFFVDDNLDASPDSDRNEKLNEWENAASRSRNLLIPDASIPPNFDFH